MVQEILEMIEGVKSDDTDTLDEIDARVWCVKHKVVFVNSFKSNGGYPFFSYDPPDSKRLNKGSTIKYTRSRDALKAIRPEGSSFGYSVHPCTLGNFYATISGEDHFCVSPPGLPTEELAELHAIIQAIEWENQRKDKKVLTTR